ncbi:MAG: peptidyl-prolyl cis-trans isomerase [Treponema sp.]|jgi:parvulin-like peptidyl-prolyl isomerase|nr:peptidyl-prolyl cis-trans isomerase [Treponema sp.]
MKHFFLFLSFFALPAAAAFTQMDLQPVAVVRLSKSQPVSVKEFRDYVNWMNLSRSNAEGAAAPLSAEERRQILETITNQLLACQAAEQDNVSVTDRELNQAVEDELKPLTAFLTQKLGRVPVDADIDNELRTQTGMTRAGFREQIRRSLLTNKYLQFKKQAMFQSAKPPTEAEIQTLYNQLRDKSFFEGGFVRPDTIRIKMIWVPITSQVDKARALERATQLSRQIGGDAGKFDEVVDDSHKPNSGYEGGDGPYLYKSDQVRAALGIDFYDTAFRLKQGEVSKLLERPDGYYLLKVIETLRQKTLTLDDIYRLEDPRRTTVKNYLLITESQKRQMEVIEKASLELVEELKKRGSVQIMDSTYNSIVW